MVLMEISSRENVIGCPDFQILLYTAQPKTGVHLHAHRFEFSYGHARRLSGKCILTVNCSADNREEQPGGIG